MKWTCPCRYKSNPRTPLPPTFSYFINISVVSNFFVYIHMHKSWWQDFSIYWPSFDLDLYCNLGNIVRFYVPLHELLLQVSVRLWWNQSFSDEVKQVSPSVFKNSMESVHLYMVMFVIQRPQVRDISSTKPSMLLCMLITVNDIMLVITMFPLCVDIANITAAALVLCSLLI